MNTNNRNNNRRRGRNNNRSQGGGGNQGNRIDSRARGNAPQMLEKYRKLAHDASLNGDRVQTEYFLQFADHYFRVLADSRSQKEEQRPRYQDRDSQGDDFYGDDEDMDGGNRQSDSRREQGDRDDRNQDRESRGRPDRNHTDRNQNDSDRETVTETAEVSAGSSGSNVGEEENPFLRESRPRKPRTPRAPRERTQAEGEGDAPAEAPARPRRRAPAPKEEQTGFDAGILPPSITREDTAEAPKRVTRTRKPRKTSEGDAENLEAVG